MGLFFIHQMIYEYGQPQWKGTDKVKPKKLGEEPIIVPLFPPKISHGPTRARARAFAERGRRLLA
jgi:hypothetical protein